MKSACRVGQHALGASGDAAGQNEDGIARWPEKLAAGKGAGAFARGGVRDDAGRDGTRKSHPGVARALASIFFAGCEADLKGSVARFLPFT
jgi:hypothetical protein